MVGKISVVGRRNINNRSA